MGDGNVIRNSKQGEFALPLGDKDFIFKFGMIAYEILFEELNFFRLCQTAQVMKAVRASLYAGAISASKQNGLSSDLSFDDFAEVLEELEPTEKQKTDVFLACMDSLGLMAKKSGADADKVETLDALGKQVRETITASLESKN